MTRRSLLALLAIAGGAVWLPILAAREPQQLAGAASADSVTVFFVRHAEKAKEPADDPLLSDTGRARAEQLAHVLSDAGVSHLFSTHLQRTIQTLQPLADRLGLEITSSPAGSTMEQIAALRALEAGSVAVVAGHSNTVPALVEGLGGSLEGLVQHERYGPILPDHEYDRLIVVTCPAEAAAPEEVRVLPLRFGVRSSP
jgi:phosphohistidine phosphatase SixA